MTRITPEALEEFEELWRQDHPDKKITKDQLLEKVQRVLNIVELIYKPIPKEKEKEFKKLFKNN